MTKVAQFINENFSFADEFFRINGYRLPQGKFSCPNPNHVHSSNTPSAKAYGNGFKCFGQCQRYFTLYDYLKLVDPHRIDEIKGQYFIETVDTRVAKESLKAVDVSDCITIKQALTKICNVNKV